MTMSETPKGEMIPVRSPLSAKVGGRFPGIDADAIAKAEAALASLSNNFTQWLEEEITKLEKARQVVHEQGLNAENCERLYISAHDLKGLGTTYEFPIITRLAASLCRLIDEPERRSKAPLLIIDAHIDAIKAAVRANIRDDGHPVGKALAEELEAKVNQFLAG
jgi:chemotaxis protein histidine kinase CheA